VSSSMLLFRRGVLSWSGIRRAACAAGVCCLLAGAQGVGAKLVAELDAARPETWGLPRAHLYAVDALGESVWAVGYWGTVLRSSDGGQTWERGSTPSSATLYGVDFATAQRGWAVGGNGALLVTSDGGATWQAQTVELVDEVGDTLPLDTTLFDVSAVSENEAWAVGDLGLLLHTRDGSTWERVPLDATAYADENLTERILNAVEFASPQRGYVAGEFGTLLRTQDGGQTWQGERALVEAPEEPYLFGLAAGADGVAAVGLAGSVLIAGPDALLWKGRPVQTTAALYAVAVRGTRALVAGDRGVIYASDDRGVSWKLLPGPEQFNWLTSVAFATDTRAFAVGEHGIVLRTEDGGSSWTRTAEVQ
jgi:photosystem II stability/assembly factor-like uncharacterized protein